MYFLGIDVGSKTLGIAICDSETKIPSPLCTIRFGENNFAQAVGLLRSRLKAWNHPIERFVVGWPANRDGSGNKATRRVEAFVAELGRQMGGCACELVDEANTTKAANEILFDMGLKASARGRHVDKISAGLILEAYLNARGG